MRYSLVCGPRPRTRCLEHRGKKPSSPPAVHLGPFSEQTVASQTRRRGFDSAPRGSHRVRCQPDRPSHKHAWEESHKSPFITALGSFVAHPIADIGGNPDQLRGSSCSARCAGSGIREAGKETRPRPHPANRGITCRSSRPSAADGSCPAEWRERRGRNGVVAQWTQARIHRLHGAAKRCLRQSHPGHGGGREASRTARQYEERPVRVAGCPNLIGRWPENRVQRPSPRRARPRYLGRQRRREQPAATCKDTRPWGGGCGLESRRRPPRVQRDRRLLLQDLRHEHERERDPQARPEEPCPRADVPGRRAGLVTGRPENRIHGLARLHPRGMGHKSHRNTPKRCGVATAQ